MYVPEVPGEGRRAAGAPPYVRCTRASLRRAQGVPYVPRTVAPQAAVDLEARLKSLQAGFRSRNHFWHISTALAQSLSAGSLLFARAALCCERCGNRDEQGCRNFAGVTVDASATRPTPSSPTGASWTCGSGTWATGLAAKSSGIVE